MDYQFIRQRITELREKKGVAEYKMSLELGHSRNYIQNIANGKSKPSIEEFLYICDYLGVTPSDFFDEQNKRPILIQKAVYGMSSLSDQDILLIISLIDRMKNGSHNP